VVTVFEILKGDVSARSASFGTNPFEWFRSTLSPGLRQQRPSREVDTTKRTQAQGDSQSIFDTITPEVEKAQQADTKMPNVRQSDHVREQIDASRPAASPPA